MQVIVDHITREREKERDNETVKREKKVCGGSTGGGAFVEHTSQVETSLNIFRGEAGRIPPTFSSSGALARAPPPGCRATSQTKPVNNKGSPPRAPVRRHSGK